MVAVDLVDRELQAAALAGEAVVLLPLGPFGALHLLDDGAVLVAAVDEVAHVQERGQRGDFPAAGGRGDLAAGQGVEGVDQARVVGTGHGLQPGWVILVGEVMRVAHDGEGRERDGRFGFLGGKEGGTGKEGRGGRAGAQLQERPAG